MHAKTALFDDQLVMLGSANLNSRSFTLNFELDCLFGGPALNEQLARRFEQDQERCLEVTLEDLERRGWLSKVLDAGANLLSPLIQVRFLGRSAVLLCSLLTCGLVAAQEEGAFPESLIREDQLLCTVPPLRQSLRWLEERGLGIEVVYTGEVFGNTRGGIRTDDARDYRGDISLYATFETGTAGLWDGGTLFLHLEEGHGGGVTEAFVGDHQVVSNIDADHFAQVSAIYYRQAFLDGLFWVQAGKQDGNDLFAAAEHGLAFIHSSAGLPPTIPMPTFPDTGVGVLAGVDWEERISLAAGLFNGRPNGGRSFRKTFQRLHGPFVIAQLTLHYELPSLLAGHLQIGGWWSGDRIPLLDRRSANPGTIGESYGGWVILDQWLFREDTPQGADPQGVAAFIQYGAAPQDRSEVEHYAGAGIVWTGAIPTRDRDTIGLGVYYAQFSRELVLPEPNETAVEVLLGIEVLPWLTLKLDQQTIFHPGGADVHTAVVLGARIEAAF